MMNIQPTESPLYGGGTILITIGSYAFNSSDSFYLVFCGSEIRHVVPASPIWDQQCLKLQGQIPGHSFSEDVDLSGYRYSPEFAHISPVFEPTPFRYASDAAHQVALNLAASVDCPESLEDLDRGRVHSSPGLDDRLTAAFKTVQLPPCWSLLGSCYDDKAQGERLLHFSARLGFSRLCAHLLTLPAAREALSCRNREGLLPEELAAELGHYELAELLTSYRTEGVVGPLVHDNDISSQVVVSTHLSWSNRDLEYDISEIERLKASQREMKSQHLSQNGLAETGPIVLVTTDGEDSSACLDQSSSIVQQTRVLEDNLRRLRGIHESIQQLRQQNTRKIAEHCQSSGSARLSRSCPVLSPDVTGVRDVHFQTMRTFHQKRPSFSANSRSLDSTLFDAINVKIHINDVTPTVSQECLLDHGVTNGRAPESRVATNIGGTTSRRLAKKSGGKKGPVRRQSWSSLGGAGAGQVSVEDRQTVQRRWSLSSLDSDTDDTFHSSSGCLRDGSCSQCSSGVCGTSPDQSITKDNHLGELSLSKSSKQSISVPSMRVISPVDIKENLQPCTANGDHGHCSSSNGITSKSFFASLRSAPLQKSLSTPSIAVEDADEIQLKVKQESSNRQSMCILQPSALSEDGNDPSPPADVAKNILFQPVSLAGVLRESQRIPATADSDEEKPFSKRKKRSSIFFKKKPDKHKAKESKKTAHQFIAYQGSSNNCDVCHKTFVKKQALKCENCLVVVHDSSCKDQVVDCNKFKLQSAQAKPSYLPVSKDSPVPSPSAVNGTSWRLPHYPNRYLHLVRPLSQSMGHIVANQNKNSQQTLREKYGLPYFHGFQANTGIPSLSEAATRSSFVNLGKMGSEDNDGNCDPQSNITEINSASMESLDEGAVDISDLEDNQVLKLTDEEPETWNATVDKKILKKLNNKEVKKQEAIYELIITEKHHCLNLQIMQKVYAQGLMKELNMSRETVERLFPCLPELLEFHMTFLSRLRERQNENSIVDHIADILEEQFLDQKAEQLKIAYGQFCSQHLEALNLYKEWAKSDRKFQNFIKKCSTKRLCKTKGIPECLLLVTQRITKYILVVESLLKAAKENKEEQQTLTQVLKNVKDIISQVDVQVAEKAKELRLLEIYNKMDPKTAIYYRGKKFKKSDLIANNRKLVRDGPLSWRSPRGKTIDVLGVMISDFIFFLHENNQKLLFASLENKPGIVSLQKLLVRKKAGADSRGMYLISSNPNEPEMVELFCHTLKDQKAWMDAVREAVDQCPDEDEGVPSETEEERKMDAARNARVKELIGLLHERDINIAQLCEERMRLMADVMETVGVDAEHYEHVRYTHLMDSECEADSKEFLTTAINSASCLTNYLYTSGTNLSRSVSSAGEHQSDNYVSPLLPKRAETFGGFDNPSKEPILPSSKVPALKKKLLHLKEHAEVSFLPSKMKIPEDFLLTDSLEMALRGFDSKTASLSRPSSMLASSDKQQSRKHSSYAISPQNSLPTYREIGTETMHLTATPLLVNQSKEQLLQIVELAHHLNTIACTVTQYASTVESLKVQLMLSNEKITKLTKEKELRERRPMYRPEHQLEELRNLQKQLNHDRAVWQQEKSQNEMEQKTTREQLQRLQDQLKTEQQDVTHQRELLYRKLDALQKQGIILSPSHTVLNNCISRDSEDIKTTDIPSDSTAQHRRTFSCDLEGGGGGNTMVRQDSKGRPSSTSLPNSGNKVVPLHLSSSATNLQKRQSITSQTIRQQLPLKLAASNSIAANNGIAIASTTQGSQNNPQQVLPLKLALGTLPSSIPAFLSQEENSGNIKTTAPKRSHSAASSPSSTLTAPVHVRGGSSPALVTYPVGMSQRTDQYSKLTGEKHKNRKRDSNEEIFC